MKFGQENVLAYKFVGPMLVVFATVKSREPFRIVQCQPAHLRASVCIDPKSAIFRSQRALEDATHTVLGIWEPAMLESHGSAQSQGLRVRVQHAINQQR